MFKLQLDLFKKKKKNLEKFKCYAEITILREKKGREREYFFFSITSSEEHREQSRC